jgi:hypothetical protein
VAALSACSRGFSVEGRIAGVFDVAAEVAVVRVKLPSGSITVQPSDDGRIHYEGATLKAASRAEVFEALAPIALDLTAEVSGDTLVLTAPALPAGVDDPGAVLVARVAMSVPRHLALDLDTARGPVAVVGRDAPVAIHTGSGDLRIDGVHGNAVAVTGSGNAIVANHQGSLELRSEHGDHLVYVDWLGPGGVKLAVGTGSVQCNLPPAAGLDLDLRTELGEISSGYPIALEQIGKGGAAGRGHVGAEPRLPVEIRCKIGSISVRPFVRG